MEQFEENTRIRPKDSYTSGEEKAISLLSFTGEEIDPPFPFGSASYVIQKYPGDLDLTQQLVCSGPPDKCVKKLSKELVRIVSDVIDKDCHWITDIKAGIDVRFDMDIGPLVMGRWTVNMSSMDKLLSMVSKRDKLAVLDIMGSEIGDSEMYDLITKILREYKICRWKPKQILNGSMKKNGIRISLVDALSMASQCKIDMVSKLNGRYVETTNMFYIGSIIDGELYIINTSYDFTDQGEVIKKYTVSMREEIEKFFYSKVWRNPFKGAKRMWAFSRVLEDVPTNNILTPLISGGLSALYQIKSEIGTILLVLELADDGVYDEKSVQCVKKDLFGRLEAWKSAIAHTSELSDHEMRELFALIDRKEIELLEDTLSRMISEKTVQQMTKVGVYPISGRYLPSPRRY